MSSNGVARALSPQQAIATLLCFGVLVALLLGLAVLQQLERVADAVQRHATGASLQPLLAVTEQARLAVQWFAWGAVLACGAVFAAGFVRIRRRLAHGARLAAELRDSQTRLSSSERRLRTIADRLPALIAYVDRSETYRFTNAPYQQLFGRDPASFVGQTMAEALGPAAHAALEPHIAAVLAGERRQFEKQGMGMAPDAVFMVDYLPDVDVDVDADADAEGRVAGFYVMALDITARTRAERALAHSERRLRDVTNHLPAIVSHFGADHRCTFANAQFKALYGVEPATLLGQTQREYRGEAVHAQIAEHLDAAMRGERRQFEVEATIGGRRHWLQQTVIPDLDGDGRVVGYFSMSFDVTLLKEQADALRKSELFLERTNRLAGVGGWELDVVQKRVFWSDETRRIHRVAPDYQPTHDTAINFYAPSSRPLISAAVQNGIATGEPWDLELQLICADGETIWVRTVGSVEFADGKPVRLFGAFQDVNERKAQQLALEEANERVALATDSGRIGIWQLDLQTQALSGDTWIRRLFGDPDGTCQDLVGLWRQRVHPDDIGPVGQAMHAAARGGAPFDTEFRVVWADGSVHHLRSAARVTREPVRGTPRLTGATWDITELRRLAADLADDRALLSVTLESIGDAVITTDAAGCVTWLNPVGERLTGWLAAEARGRPLLQVFHIVEESTREPAPDPVASCLQLGQTVALAQHTLLLSRDGSEYGIEDSAAPIRNAAGKVLGAVLVFHDVSEQRRLSGEMSYRATHDALTGLVNRGEFEARLLRLLKKSHDDGGQHALLYIDLDQFKLVNDACGHAVGDQLLQQMGKLLGDAVRARDTLARLGGDEFGILLEHCTVEQAQRVAQKICDRMDDFRFIHDDRRFRIGTSIGLVPVDRRWATTAALQQAADTSCYAAKEAGRNRVHAWFDTDSTMRERHFEMQWTTRIEQALDEGGFELYAQRIVPLAGREDEGPNGVKDGARGDAPPHRRGVHAEVLLRMRQADGTLVLPGAFLPAAERFHLVSRIDRWVLQRALAWLAGLAQPATIELLSVNLSGQSVGDRSFHRWALDQLALAGAGVRSRLCLEITETAAVTNMADAASFVHEVRAAGVKVALDDFGAGASSFGYLKSLPVDFLKIDGQFVRDLVDDPLDEAAVRCFADVARVIGVKTVAEYVDKPAVLARLREMRIDYAQGFLLHRPEPLQALLEPCRHMTY